MDNEQNIRELAAKGLTNWTERDKKIFTMLARKAGLNVNKYCSGFFLACHIKNEEMLALENHANENEIKIKRISDFLKKNHSNLYSSICVELGEWF